MKILTKIDPMLLKLTHEGKNKLLGLIEDDASEEQLKDFWNEYHIKLTLWKEGVYESLK